MEDFYECPDWLNLRHYSAYFITYNLRNYRRGEQSAKAHIMWTSLAHLFNMVVFLLLHDKISQWRYKFHHVGDKNFQQNNTRSKYDCLSKHCSSPTVVFI